MTLGASSSLGFTLIEILVVLLLIGLFTVIVVGGTRSLPEDALNQAARQVLATAETARSGALLSSIPQTLVYALDSGRVWFEVPSAEDPQEPPRKLCESALPRGVRLVAVHLDAQTNLSSGEVRIAARAGGVVPAHLVHLRHTEGDLERTVVVSPFPGHSRIAPGRPDWEAMLPQLALQDVPGVGPLPLQ